MKKIFFIFFIFFLISGCKDSSSERKNEYIAKCISEDSSKKMESFCECCYIESQKFKPKRFTNSHIEMLENQEINYKDAIEENCINLLY